MCVLYRYKGESKEEIKDEKPDHLSRLLRKIEERKRQRAAASEESVSGAVKSDIDKPKKKKRKLSDATEFSDSHKNTDNNNETVSEQITGTNKGLSKKEKKKKKNIDFDIVEEDKKVEETVDKNVAIDTESNEKKTSDKKNFVILGAKTHKKQREVKRVLPDWLAHPEIVSADLKSGSSFEDLKSILDDKLIEVLKTKGIRKLFPVQSSIIKWLHKCSTDRKLGLWPRDTCISAPTGSGKCLKEKKESYQTIFGLLLCSHVIFVIF